MIEPVEGEPNTYTVYYNILDSDQSGRDPDCKNFNKEQASCIDKISANYNKVMKINIGAAFQECSNV